MIIFKFQKHNLKVSKCHKIECLNIFFTHKKRRSWLPTRIPDLIHPESAWVGLVQVGGKKNQNPTQLDPTMFDWFGYFFPLNPTRPDPCTPLCMMSRARTPYVATLSEATRCANCATPLATIILHKLSKLKYDLITT